MKFADRNDAYNFGPDIELAFVDGGGRLVPLTRWMRVKVFAYRRWIRATRWFRPRVVVAKVDRRSGSVSLAEERWSWRRWQWERS